MIEETKIQRAFAWILFVSGIGIGYSAFGEDIIDKVFQIFGIVFKDKHDPSAILPSLLGIVTAIAGAQGITKGAKGWLDYRRERDCRMPREAIAPEEHPKAHKK